MSDKQIDITEQLDKFKLSHYKNADFESLNYKAIQLFNKFKTLKDKGKQNRVVLDLYTLYLQSIEILFINAHALSVKLDHFPSALFIDSNNLRRFVDENFSKITKLSTWFLVNQIFAIRSADKDYKESYELYTALLKEVAKDYLSNYDLLNAYKHGYRINAKHDKTTLSLVTRKGKHFMLDESDSTIVYFSKETIKGVPTIFEHSLNFKLGRIFGKSIFVTTLLNNIRMSTLLRYKQSVRGHSVARFYVEDKKKWSESIGSSHFKKPIFSLKKK